MKKKRKFLSFLFISFSWARRAVLLRWERSRTVFFRKKKERSFDPCFFGACVRWHSGGLFYRLVWGRETASHEAQSIVSLPVHGGQHTLKPINHLHCSEARKTSSRLHVNQ